MPRSIDLTFYFASFQRFLVIAQEQLNFLPERTLSALVKLYDHDLSSYPFTEEDTLPVNFDASRIVERFLKTREYGKLAAAALEASAEGGAEQSRSEDTVHLPNIPLKYKSNVDGKWFGNEHSLLAS